MGIEVYIFLMMGKAFGLEARISSEAWHLVSSFRHMLLVTATMSWVLGCAIG